MYQVVSVKDDKEYVECCKKDRKEAEIVKASIEKVLGLSGRSVYIKEC
jgi:hypothetical protein